MAEFERAGTEEDLECLHYVRYEAAGSSGREFPPNGRRDCDSNGALLPERKRADGSGMLLKDFVEAHSSKVANLSMAHVLALRLYTTAAYKSLNNPFRATGAGDRFAHPFPVTMIQIVEGLGRLRAVVAEDGDATRPVDLFRGMRNIIVSEESNPEFLQKGGTELSLMSTTGHLEVAMQYAASGENSLLFKLRTNTYHERGADVSYLSVYPSEAEFLYPPLTYLRPTSTKHVVRTLAPIADEAPHTFRVVEVEPSMQLGM